MAKLARHQHRLGFLAHRGGASGEIGGTHFTAQHFPHQLQPRKICGGILANQLAIAQHRQAVRHRINLIEKMGDKNNPESVGAQFAHDRKQLGDFALIQTGSGFVEHEQLRLRVEGTGDRDHLLKRHRQRAKLGVDIALDFQTGQRGPGSLAD